MLVGLTTIDDHLTDLGKIMKSEERRLGISYDLSNLEEGGTR